MSQLKDDLQALRTLLTPEEAWIKGSFARSKSGDTVPSNSPAAVCWCTLGATRKVTDRDPVREDAVTCQLEKLANARITNFNDDPLHSHGDILNLIDQAIKVAA